MNSILKRFMDISISITSLIILMPVMIIIAVLIKLDSKGPVLFSQERLTYLGHKFVMLKFRTMIMNAEKSGTGLFNYKNDPRVTKIGRVLRNTSLDELPQLINVAKGSLSLVGPRPPVTYELGDFATLNKRYKKRFKMKAGITGLAQVMGRNDLSWDQKVFYDNKYIDLFEKYGVMVDIKILLLTFVNVFKNKNIYEVKVDKSIDDIEAATRAEAEVIRLAHLPDSDNVIEEQKELIKLARK